MLEREAAVLFLAAVCWWDVGKRRIPNSLVVAGATASLGFLILKGVGNPGEAGICRSLAAVLAPAFARALLAFFVGFWLWTARMIGAGDVKLAAVLLGWLGFDTGGRGIFLGMLLGAVWSLGRLLNDRELALRLRQLVFYAADCLRDGRIKPYERWKRDGKRAVIPLGACMALGVMAALWLG